MNLLSINNLAKIGRENPLFTGVTFGIQEGEKAALIGRNGCGKSTLLNTIAGILQPDEGNITINRECGISFLPQNPAYKPEDTIRDHIFKSKSPKLNVIREYQLACEALAGAEGDAGAGEGGTNTGEGGTSAWAGSTEKAQKAYNSAMEKMDKLQLWDYEAQIASILGVLGIHDMERKMGTLSGGMIKKVALAQVLVEDTKLLLLDEPTNHLDISTISWLQNYLHDMKRSLLMVTHDRWFLDAVCTNIYELARGKIKLYEGNYSQYLEKKETEAEIEANTERRIESVLRFERDWLLRGPCARGTKAKARIQRDMQLINREKFAADKGFTFEVKGRRLGGKVLELHNISKNYPKGFAGKAEGTPVIKNFSYKFTKGEKIGIFGDNGSGKSTLLNIITGQLAPDTGTIDTGVNTSFGYYTQNPVFKDTSLTVLEYIKEAAERMTLNDGKKEVSATKFLEEFGFEGKIQHSPVSTLSGGERKKLYLVRLLLQNPNFLVLDEPTNDFDIFTMNILEQFLMGYEGCLLLVSHDRYFMDKCADTLFILEDDGSISGFVGKCSEYVEYRDELRKFNRQQDAKQPVDVAVRNANGGEKITTATTSPSLQPASQSSATLSAGEAPATPPAAPKKKLSFKEQREFEQLDAEIPALEAEQKALEEKMSSSDFETARTAGEKYKELSARLEEKYARWSELAELA